MEDGNMVALWTSCTCGLAPITAHCEAAAPGWCTPMPPGPAAGLYDLAIEAAAAVYLYAACDIWLHEVRSP